LIPSIIYAPLCTNTSIFTVDVGPEPTAASESEEGAEDNEDDDNEDAGEGEDEDDDDDEEEEEDDEEVEFEDEGDDPVSNKKGRSSTGSGDSSFGLTSSGNTALDARAKLAANLLLLTGPELGHVITRLEQSCPAALEILAPDAMVVGSSNARPGTAIPGKMEIVLDLVEAPLLKELSEYTTKVTAIRKRGRVVAAAAAAEKAAAAAAEKALTTAANAATAAAATATAANGKDSTAAAAGSTEHSTSPVPASQGSQQGSPDGMEIDDIANKKKRKK
jgi:hypothetical protein